jgi:uncharacterized protein YydD (DUF2326 family)
MKTAEEIEEFVTTAINAKPPLDRMAKAYRTAVEATERQQARLLRQLRIRDGKVYFKEEVKEVEPDLKKAEEAEQDMKNAINEYLECLGTFSSVAAMTERLARLKRQVENVKHEADSLLKQAVNSGVERPQEDHTYLAACDKRDRVVSETANEIIDLSQRTSRINALLGRF